MTTILKITIINDEIGDDLNVYLYEQKIRISFQSKMVWELLNLLRNYIVKAIL